jgi:hypothetical protein
MGKPVQIASFGSPFKSRAVTDSLVHFEDFRLRRDHCIEYVSCRMYDTKVRAWRTTCCICSFAHLKRPYAVGYSEATGSQGPGARQRTVDVAGLLRNCRHKRD